jgi:hypothetical protein
MNYLRSKKYSNILLLNIPFRYDLPNSYAVNKKISILNKKLQKLVRVSPHTRILVSDNDRKLFTNHGLHHNKLCKTLVTSQLTYHILNTFQYKISPPIPLGWYKSVDEIKPLCDIIQAKLLSRSSSHNRKTPVTRSNNFLWSTYAIIKLMVVTHERTILL